MHQAWVIINQQQNNKFNEFFTCIINESHQQGLISAFLKEAFEAFQVEFVCVNSHNLIFYTN